MIIMKTYDGTQYVMRTTSPVEMPMYGLTPTREFLTEKSDRLHMPADIAVFVLLKMKRLKK